MQEKSWNMNRWAVAIVRESGKIKRDAITGCMLFALGLYAVTWVFVILFISTLSTSKNISDQDRRS